MKKFSQVVVNESATYAENLGKSKRMQEKTPRNETEMHLAKHDLVVHRAQPIKGGHRFTVSRHFTEDKGRDMESMTKDVNKAVSSSKHPMTIHSKHESTTGVTPNHNHSFKVDVHYN